MRQLKITQSITNRESASLEKYLHDISKEEMVTPQEEVELAQKIRNGDANALNRLTRANLRFVVSVAKQYQNQGMGLPDLINEGNLGLIKAAQRFDETKGFKFISYAVWWIRQSILQAIAEQSRLVRLPLNQIGTLNKVRQSFSQLEQHFQREPSAEELAQVLNFPINHVNDVMRVSAKHVSFDAPIDSNEDSSTLLDFLNGDESSDTDSSMIIESMTNDINRCLSVLSSKEAHIVKMFFGIGYSHNMSLDEISASVHLTRERIRQIKEGALRKLKSNRSNGFLKSYL